MKNKRAVISAVFFIFSLFLVLFQIRLFAGELADTPVFLFSLAAAAAAAGILAFLNIKTIQFLIITAFAPLLARALIALPGLFTSNEINNGMLIFDLMLLNFDRNAFVFLFPFYLTAVFVYFLLNFPRFIKAAVILNSALFVIIFCAGKSAGIAIYEKPLVLIIIVALFAVFEVFSLIFGSHIISNSKIHCNIKINKIEKTKAVIVIVLLIVLGCFFSLRPAEKNALAYGGGLLTPKLFSFDFAPFLHLENKIEMNDNLVFIVQKKTQNNESYLLRRFVLSSYDTKNGWTRNNEIDEAVQPNRLPPVMSTYKKNPRQAVREMEADYFLVNIDVSAFIAFAEPIKVTPYITQNTASYKASYSVLSETSTALPYELISVDADDFSEIDFDYYTKFEEKNGGRIKKLAEELTDGITNYWERAQVLYLYLKYGDYRYSLKPGTALDGDQLGQFLFGNKKGYCSYFAFAYAALLRSIKIPCRISVGFFINPDEERLEFYPVRANMAHAWVEVFFPKYGWIEFDPTTEKLAEGENFSFSESLPPDFEKILKEILETKRIPRESSEYSENIVKNNTALHFAREAVRITINIIYHYKILVIALICFFIIINYTAGFALKAFFTKDTRKKTVLLYKFALRLLSFKKIKIIRGKETEADFAKRITKNTIDLYKLYCFAEKARFAEFWTDVDTKSFKVVFSDFLKEYRLLLGNKK